MEAVPAGSHTQAAAPRARLLARGLLGTCHLSLEVTTLFEQSLVAHYPQRASHVLSRIHQSRGGGQMSLL